MIGSILEKKLISINDSILIVAAGEKDKKVFSSFGFKNVTISNLDHHRGFKDYAPYNWIREDLESLSMDNEVYDWVFVHAGLHHCASPHKGLCEMLRVSKKGVGIIESRDSFLNAFATKLKLVSSYEIEPCVITKGTSGGFRNTHIPNFVYKWTENEVKKTVNSFLPHYKHNYHFFYGLNVPVERLSISKNPLKRIIAKVGKLVLPVFMFLFKKQGNLFGFVIEKNVQLQPWLLHDNNEIKFNMDYALKHYEPSNYKSY